MHQSRLLPSPYLSLFSYGSDFHSYNTRSASNFRPRSCRTNSKKTTILYQGQKIWNALPRSITNLSNILSFSESFENLLINYLVYKNSHALLKKPKASSGLLAKSLSLSFHLNVYIYFVYLSWQTTNELSLFHSNIRSLGASLDNLINLLPKLTLHFTIVDLSGTKLSTNQSTLLNLNIPGSKLLF